MVPTILIPGQPTARAYLDGDALDLSAPLAVTIDGVLTPAECHQMIEKIEQLGPAAAPVSTAFGAVMRPDVRNNHRVMFDDPALAAALFERVASALPPRLCDLRPVGANERFRGYRYTPGQRFAPHYDGAFVRDDHERSLLTLIVYLNEGFAGGTTTFLDYALAVGPRAGSALLFQHFLLHEGAEVRAGTKYALRTDVMYRA